MSKVTVSKNGNWQLYWGMMPLPNGAVALGTVSRDSGTGALIRLSKGNYVQGNAGSMRTLPQREVGEALAVSSAAATLGSKGGRKGGKSTSKAKAAAARANGRKGGRPKTVKE